MRVRHPWSWLASAGVLGLVVLRLTWQGWSSALPVCGVRSLTGLQCPGCGGTRCAVKLLHGDVAGALAMNPLVVGLVLVAGIFGVIVLVREWKGYPSAIPAIPSWVAWCLAGAVIGFGLVRNLPWWPFTLLVPH